MIPLPSHIQAIVDRCKAEGRTATPEENEILIDFLLIATTRAQIALDE
jgi:hypothetical protein